MTQDAAIAHDEQSNPEPRVTATTEAPAPVPKATAPFPADEITQGTPAKEAAPGPSLTAGFTDTRRQWVERRTHTPQRDHPYSKAPHRGGFVSSRRRTSYRWVWLLLDQGWTLREVCNRWNLER